MAEIRYIVIPDEVFSKLLHDHRAKLTAIRKLGIEPREGETPLRAWVRTMCEENGLPVEFPAPSAIQGACTGNEVAAFLYFIA